ncbi:hypothetical protein METBIDRAFT_142442 [Metschnikowia bicuspidata var. bicuspidata NRRL YB-4993]|uniref:Uncharacterized protein n=1 Tax=Metschnikowia bicuspidata var. bicuspidata NRRL YB-4993 TaxID=869754 RepID=A0A1A0HDD7_9ASCO|nr:hypothetical protein METBIDRAFT_142442 [Metschnikowia bicuspidata var. bicuspidata NRRL YB-4993]OBA21943.1 hypothetical protein METBIDRAFT_142442 [Metschnikowia bicuspidata var. bicuspidata NRRL YB-4993]
MVHRLWNKVSGFLFLFFFVSGCTKIAKPVSLGERAACRAGAEMWSRVRARECPPAPELVIETNAEGDTESSRDQHTSDLRLRPLMVCQISISLHDSMIGRHKKKVNHLKENPELNLEMAFCSQQNFDVGYPPGPSLEKTTMNFR